MLIAKSALIFFIVSHMENDLKSMYMKFAKSCEFHIHTSAFGSLQQLNLTLCLDKCSPYLLRPKNEIFDMTLVCYK